MTRAKLSGMSDRPVLQPWPERPLDLMLVGNLWRHYAWGEDLLIGFRGAYEPITRERFHDTLLTYSPIADAVADAGISEDAAWQYAVNMAPWAVQIVGSGWSPGVYVDTTGSGA